MSRLTKVYDNGKVTLDASQFPPIDQNVLDNNINNSEPVKAAVAKLAEYEGAEENGLLVQLPFCENSDLYVICEKRVREGRRKVIEEYVTEGKLDRFYFVNGNVSFDVVVEDKTGTYVSLTREDIGKVIFFTREEAKRAREYHLEESEHYGICNL